jgi:AraC-like DNA-binding protein
MESKPHSQLIAPRLALASCVRAIIVRNTLDCPPLSAPQRINRYPASPFCGLFFLLAGETAMHEPYDPEMVSYAGSSVFTGPRTRPTATCNPGPTHFLTVMFFPDAFHRLTGLDMNRMLEQIVRLEGMLDPAWQSMAQAVHAAPDDASRIALLEDFLEPRWQAVRPISLRDGGKFGDWVRRLAVQAAAAGLGSSTRMAERRIREWAGLPMRKLRRLQRAEQVFMQARDDALAGKLSLSDLAQQGGYADQAHLSREAREIVGISPSALLKEGLDDESYWVYRIWR